MRKAIGTSIRTANSELRKVARHRLEANNFLNDTNNEGEKGQGGDFDIDEAGETEDDDGNEVEEPEDE